MEIKIYKSLNNATRKEGWYCVLNNYEVTKNTPIALVVENNNILGHCMMSGASGDELYIDHLYIKSAYHNKGIGTKLLKTVKKWAIDENFQSISLSTNSDNYAKYIYYKEGFNLVGGRDITDKYDYEFMVMSQSIDPEVKLISALLDCARNKIDGKNIKTVREGLSHINEGSDIDSIIEYSENEPIDNKSTLKEEIEKKIKYQYYKTLLDCRKHIKDDSSLLYECADIIDSVIKKRKDETHLAFEATGNVKKYKLTGLSNEDINKCDEILCSYSTIRLDRQCPREEIDNLSMQK